MSSAAHSSYYASVLHCIPLHFLQFQASISIPLSFQQVPAAAARAPSGVGTTTIDIFNFPSSVIFTFSSHACLFISLSPQR